jgi:hypothetical protein
MKLALVPGKFEGLPLVRQISVMLSLVHLTIVEDCSGEAAALLLPSYVSAHRTPPDLQLTPT